MLSIFVVGLFFSVCVLFAGDSGYPRKDNSNREIPSSNEKALIPGEHEDEITLWEKRRRKEFEDFTDLLTGDDITSPEWLKTLYDIKTAQVIYADQKIISYRLDFEQNTGGVHELHQVYTGTIARVPFPGGNGHLKLADIANEDQLPLMRKSILNAFQFELTKRGYDFKIKSDDTMDTRFPLPEPKDNFYFDDNGLHFIYNEYEIHCYAAGYFDICIDWPLPESVSFAFKPLDTDQQEYIYNEAKEAFDERNLEKCRSLLGGMLTLMDSSDPMFDSMASLLGRVSMHIYRSGFESDYIEEYTVKDGDTLSAIADKYKVSVSAIYKINEMTTYNLRIGQELKIPQIVWSIRIRRADNKLFLYANGRMFKIYNIKAGTLVPSSLSGLYQIVSKQKSPAWRVDGKTYQPGTKENFIGERWIALKGIGSNANAPGTAIHGTNQSGTPDPSSGTPGYFSMSNDDAVELYELVSRDTIVEIQ